MSDSPLNGITRNDVSMCLSPGMKTEPSYTSSMAHHSKRRISLNNKQCQRMVLVKSLQRRHMAHCYSTKTVKICAASNWHFTVLCKSSRKHDVSGIRRNSFGTSKRNREYHEEVMLFLNYEASQEEAVVTYHASDMVLACHSDASYLSEPGSFSRA